MGATLSENISAIDLPVILEAEGIQLRRSGNGYQFRCCFHDDRHPSAGLYNKGRRWHWHCFVCNEGGDAVDFIQKRHGLDFKGACRYLGLSNKPLTRSQRARIKKTKYRHKINEAFKTWELAAIDELRDTISTAYRISSRWRTPEDMTRIIDPVADLQGQLDVLMLGPKKDRIGIYNRWKQRGGWF